MAAREVRRWRITPTPATAHDGDRPLILDREPGGPEAVDEAVHARLGQVDRVGHPDRDGRSIVEVVVDGWRFEFTVEDEERAALRDRASRVRATGGTDGGRLEIRAIIPGRIAALTAVAGDTVVAGQALLVVEAMKMQNELRAPRDGTLERVAVAAGDTIEIGDLLVVLA